MSSLKSCLLIALLGIPIAEECYDAIKELAEHNKCLSSRKDAKITKAQIATSPQEYKSLMKIENLCN